MNTCNDILDCVVPLVENIQENNDTLKKNIFNFVNQECETLKDKHLQQINNFKKKLTFYNEKIDVIVNEKQNLEKEVENLKKNILEKNNCLIELEGEKQNWNKVSHIKHLDKKYKDKNNDYQVLNLRFNTITKQNAVLRSQINELKKNIKPDNESPNETKIETEVLPKDNESPNETKIETEVLPKDNESQDDTKIETEEKVEYIIYEFVNKSGNSKKYLRGNNENNDMYLFNYTPDLSVTDNNPVGILKKKDGILKPSFYRKKK